MTRDITLGIISTPGRAADLTSSMIEGLADEFSKNIHANITWNIDRVVDSLIGTTPTASEILKRTVQLKEEKEWDFAISVTDLPTFHKQNIVAADINKDTGTAQISTPAYGWILIKNKIKKAMIYLLKELLETMKVDTSSSPRKSRLQKTLHVQKKEKFPVRFIRRHEHADSKDDEIDIRYIVYPKVNGMIRLVAGMIFSNNPLKIISSFKKVIAIAFTTGTFALIFPTVWKLSNLFSNIRLTSMMIAAIAGLVVWIISAHGLWIFRKHQKEKRLRYLYNLSTISALFINVFYYYIILFSLFLITSFLLVPAEHIVDIVSDDGKLSIHNYLKVAWVISSLSTIVSAIGAGLENEELVKSVTYGYRQISRYENSK